MQKILLIGAGKSSSWLIKYLSEHATSRWTLTIADVSLEHAQQKITNPDCTNAVAFNIDDLAATDKLISGVDIVISMLPAHMHMPVAKACLKNKKSLVTASYVSSEMQLLNEEVKNAGLVFMNECGLDPGIDHLSAMKIIDEVKASGGHISSFKSYCGGLVAPESNNNPWGYKFSWNPRNVILAGQGTATYLDNHRIKRLPYNRLFEYAENISVDGCGSFDGYANRDSLSYQEIYGLQKTQTMLRGTLRQQHYCKAWNVFVRLGFTDDTYTMHHLKGTTYRELIQSFLPEASAHLSLKERIFDLMHSQINDEIYSMIEWTGILSDEKISFPEASPAMVLQELLERKWKLEPHDKDMIVMQHLFETENSTGIKEKITSSLVVTGVDNIYTAMAKTVGLPVAIMARMILEKKINQRGVCIPVQKEVYEPMLHELSQYGITFTEKKEKYHS